MKKKRAHRKVSKFILILVSSLIFLIFSTHFYLKVNSNKILKNYLIKLESKSGGKYSISSGACDIDFIGSSITAKNFQIEEKKKVNEVKDIPSGSGPVIKVSFINIKGVSLIKLVLFRTLSGKSVYISNGEINLRSKKKNGKVIRDKPGYLKKILFSKFYADNIKLKLFADNMSIPVLNFPSTNLSAERINIQTGKKEKTTNTIRFGNINIEAKECSLFFPKRSYRADISTLIVKNSSSISLSGIRYNRFFLNASPAMEKNLYSLTMGEINFRNISLNDLINKGKVHMEHILISDPVYKINSNRNIVIKKRRKEKKFPQQILRELPFKIKAGLVEIRNGLLIYTEKAPGQKIGESIRFTGININITNITNFENTMKSGIESRINISAKLMGKSLLKGKIIIPVNSKRDQFFFSGTLSKTDPKIFNRFLKRNSRIKINSGLVKELTFSANADRERSQGTMKLIYKDLKVSLLRKNNFLKKRKLYTFLANTILQKSNPSGRKKAYRKGKIKFVRVQKRSIFNFMWKSILSGIKSTVGL
ncbi:MAG: hypothetical protein ABFR75_05880 [Acidobacteriota bacterium]